MNRHKLSSSRAVEAILARAVTRRAGKNEAGGLYADNDDIRSVARFIAWRTRMRDDERGRRLS